MRRATLAVTAILTLCGCTPREWIGALVPLALSQCDEKRQACPPPGEVSPVDSEPPAYPPLPAASPDDESAQPPSNAPPGT